MGSGQGSVADICKHDDEPLDYTKAVSILPTSK